MQGHFTISRGPQESLIERLAERLAEAERRYDKSPSKANLRREAVAYHRWYLARSQAER